MDREPVKLLKNSSDIVKLFGSSEDTGGCILDKLELQL